MTLKECIYGEDRQNESVYTAIFHKNGMWYRAYEWSAYLALAYTSMKNTPLKALKKKFGKEKLEYLYCGLPLSSFSKYFEGLKEKDMITLYEDKVIIDFSEIFKNEDFSDYKKMLEDKKGKTESLKEDKSSSTSLNKNEKRKDIGVCGNNEINDLLMSIIDYNVLERPLSDCANFIHSLQSKIFKIYFGGL